MLDFLTFKTFISPSILIVFYYIGAVFVPILSFYLARRFKNTYFSSVTLSLSLQHYLLTIGLFLLTFLMLEVFWRMMFEMLIAYFDMHDALMQTISKEIVDEV